ncbi:MAG: Fic family protein [Paludibacteraceae bacterium]|nr:Fic family protein [Paludibacteraceae bacterium]
MNNNTIDFEEYIRQGEPDKREKASIWSAAIGLQAVDGLQTSDYLKETARRHIEGEITIDEVRSLINTYYESKTQREPDEDEIQEADKVSSNITKILSSATLDFSAKGYIALHRRIFDGVFKYAGKVRDYNITKKEWILENDTVSYLNFEDVRRALEYDIEQERKFSYKGVSTDELIVHITRFVSGIWQIHAFREGNTRTTAVFSILFLRSIGFSVDNNMFARHSWYFRNALVRANYRNAKKSIDYSPIYLERFFRNLLLGERWDLRNRYLHINPTEEWSVQPNLADQTNIEQVSSMYRASTEQVPSKYRPSSISVEKLILSMTNEYMSMSEMMKKCGLKHRETFRTNYVLPALEDCAIEREYKEQPHHPKQRYRLTEKARFWKLSNNPKN